GRGDVAVRSGDAARARRRQAGAPRDSHRPAGDHAADDARCDSRRGARREPVTYLSHDRSNLPGSPAMTMTEHISKQYDQGLEAIRRGMMQMGGLVEAHVRAAVAAYLDGDAERLEEVIAGDSKVNELEIAIDTDLGQIIVRRQPAASDLRLILAVSKTVTDL